MCIPYKVTFFADKPKTTKFCTCKYKYQYSFLSILCLHEQIAIPVKCAIPRSHKKKSTCNNSSQLYKVLKVVLSSIEGFYSFHPASCRKLYVLLHPLALAKGTKASYTYSLAVDMDMDQQCGLGPPWSVSSVGMKP